MIPKTIHYCWFGGNPLPSDVKKCLKSWKKYGKGYEITQWNETNFDLSAAPLYVKQAYEAKKWAFVSDYVRLWALCKHGGVYLDTDVELIKPLDDLLLQRAFAFFETAYSLSTGLLGAERDFPLFAQWLRSYDEKTFIDENGEMDLTINVKGFSTLCASQGFCLDNTRQEHGGLLLLPTTYLYSRLPGNAPISSATYAIHYFSGSWKTAEEQKQFEQKMAYQKKEMLVTRKKQLIKNRIKGKK